MQKHLLYINLFTITSALAFAACADEVENAVTPNVSEVGEKTPIELSVGGVDAPSATNTRAAVYTDGTNKMMKNFDKKTKVFILMQSDKEVDGSGDVVTHNGYEYIGDRPTTLYTVARGDVEANSSTLVFDENNKRYWDDAHARSSQLTMWAIAQKVANDDKDGKWKSITFRTYGATEDNTKPSIGESSDATYNTTNRIDWWDTPQVYPAIFSWSVGNLTSGHQNQDENTLIYQDLLFSNNISYNKEKSWSDRRLKFDFGTRKFPREDDVWESTTTKQTEMKFYHALSKITIQIKAGKGFKADGNDFELKNNTIDKLIGFNTRGLFNIKDGEFQLIHTNNAVITSIPCTTTANSQGNIYYTLEALAIPNIHEFMSSQKDEHGVLLGKKDDYSRFVDGSTTVMMEITVDDNTYKITSDNLYDALMTRDGEGNITTSPVTNATRKTDNGNYVPLEAGKNYVFTFTIGKQEIDHITAKLADWENVEAEEQFPSNAYVNVSVKTDEGSQVTGDPTFDLYRAPGTLYNGAATVEGYNNYADYNWEKGYEKSTSLAEKSSSSGVYTTEWYWPNNNTFYHFRTISPSNEAIQGNEATTYISVTGGTLIQVDETPATAKDYVWGAPFKSTVTTATVYSPETGFCNNATKSDGQLYKAIGATEKEITLIQHHMSSQVFVDLTNDETVAAENRVNLTGATVELINIAQEAKLYLGNGLVSDYSNYGKVGMTADAHAAASPIPAYDYSYGVLPQSLSNNNGKVGLKITAADGNVYIINDLSAIKESGKNEITDWLPGKKYYYKFKLKKTGIESLTATIVNWVSIEAEEDTIVIQ